MTWIRPDDGPEVVYEFFAPFAHVPGRYEWCHIRSPTHGAFDTFILLAERPVTVYVADGAGARFLAERYPECRAPRAARLSISESQGGRVVEGVLEAAEGPLRAARMRLAASSDAKVRNEPYGGDGRPVWGSHRWTCWGVDLVLEGVAQGRLDWADGRVETLESEPALITLGSFGRISPLPGTTPARHAAGRPRSATPGRTREPARDAEPAATVRTSRPAR